MQLRFLFTTILLLIAVASAQSQIRAAEPTDGTVLSQEGGIWLSFPKGWKPAGKESVNGVTYFMYAKTFTGDEGPEQIRVSVTVSKGGSTEKAILAAGQYFFPAKTHVLEMDEYASPFKSALLTGITHGGTVFVKSDAEDEGTPYIFYGLKDCSRNIVLAIPSVIPGDAEAELNFMLESVRCAE